MAITPLPTPPARNNADTDFSNKADALLGALPQFVNEVNATAAAMNLNSTNSVSTTPLLVEVASKSLTVEAAKSYVPGQTVKIAYTADPTKWMLGDVMSYNVSTGAMVVNVQYRQGSGTYSAWTISLAAPAPVTIPAGSKTVWFQPTAPTGWTQITSYTGGHAIRVVGGGTGGSIFGNHDFTTAFAYHTVTGWNSATTLQESQIPAHAHSFQLSDNETGAGTATQGWTAAGTQWTANTGGGGSHNHAFTGGAIDLRVKYMDMILASKD